MILYIYKIENNFNVTRDIFENKVITISNLENSFINANIVIDNSKISVIYSKLSKLIFIISETKSNKRKAFKVLYELFDSNIAPFTPTYNQMKQLICKANEKELKFIHENQIVYNNNLTKSYCSGTIEENYFFFEANLSYDDYSFLFYGNAIKIRKPYEKKLYEILSIFESYIGE